jgi:uncharacterized protein with PIN domain
MEGYPRQLVRQISTAVVRALTQEGRRDLTTLRLDDLEKEVGAVVDQVAQEVSETLLQQQGEAWSQQSPRCPTCRGELQRKGSRERNMQLRRGKACWEEPVWRCASCRRDFFPSVGGDGLCGGGGV